MRGPCHRYGSTQHVCCCTACTGACRTHRYETAAVVWPGTIPPAAFPVARLVETADGYRPELYLIADATPRPTPAYGRPEGYTPADFNRLYCGSWPASDPTPRAGHTCIACGRDHAACCGQCPHSRPPS